MTARRSFTAALLTFVAVVPATAQGGAGTSGALLLQLTPAPRPAALGAFAALADGPLALHHGPAGLAGARGAVEAAYQTLPTDASAGLAAATLPLGPGTLAAGLAFVDYGEAPEIVPDELGLVGTPTGAVVTGGEVAVSVGYGIRIGPLQVGAVARSLHVDIAGLGAGTLAVDLGVGAEALDGRVTLRAAAQHLGPEVKAGRAAPLPTLFRAGAVFRVRPGANQGALVTVEGRVPLAGLDGPRPVRGALGVEWTYRVSGVSAVGRLGYRQRAAAGDALQGFAFGGGIGLAGVGLDYAYRPMGPLGATHHIGLTYLPGG